MAAPARVGAVVVSYFTGPSLLESLRRLLDDPAVEQVALVDNGNRPETIAGIAALGDGRVRILTGHGNVGFAAGCNIGAAALTTEYLLLLNPDCLIGAGCIGPLIAAVGPRPHPWIATPRLLGSDGREQNGARRNAGTPLQCLVEALRLDRVVPGLPRVNLAHQPLPPSLVAVPAISGAFMLMPRQTWDRLNGMDPGYFLHVEDLDFCRRLANAGGAAYFWPAASATHLKSTSQASPWFVERCKIAGFWRFFRRHYGGLRWLPVSLLAWFVLSGGLMVRTLVKRVPG